LETVANVQGSWSGSCRPFIQTVQNERHGDMETVCLAIWVSVSCTLFGSGPGNFWGLASHKHSSSERAGEGQYRLDRIRIRLCCFTGQQRTEAVQPGFEAPVRSIRSTGRGCLARDRWAAFRVFRTQVEGCRWCCRIQPPGMPERGLVQERRVERLRVRGSTHAHPCDRRQRRGRLQLKTSDYCSQGLDGSRGSSREHLPTSTPWPKDGIVVDNLLFPKQPDYSKRFGLHVLAALGDG
jgi:hypothetical protein